MKARNHVANLSNENCTFSAELPISCTEGAYHCKDSDKCIDMTNVCDNVKQCPNGDDEDPRCSKSIFRFILRNTFWWNMHWFDSNLLDWF